MLRGGDPLLTADLLHALRAMGHGDTITIVDANFPGANCARRLINMPGLEVGAVFRAVLSVLPVDDFIPVPLMTMQVVGEPGAVPPAVAEVRRIAMEAGIEPERMGTTDRHDFYHVARESFCIVQTGDRRLYANVILTKGVIRVAS
jgi:L-fucose mutarotase